MIGNIYKITALFKVVNEKDSNLVLEVLMFDPNSADGYSSAGLLYTQKKFIELHDPLPPWHGAHNR